MIQQFYFLAYTPKSYRQVFKKTLVCTYSQEYHPQQPKGENSINQWADEASGMYTQQQETGYENNDVLIEVTTQLNLNQSVHVMCCMYEMPRTAKSIEVDYTGQQFSETENMKQQAEVAQWVSFGGNKNILDIDKSDGFHGDSY